MMSVIATYNGYNFLLAKGADNSIME